MLWGACVQKRMESEPERKVGAKVGSARVAIRGEDVDGQWS